MKKYLSECNYWFHGQMDFDEVFKNLHVGSFDTLEDLLSLYKLEDKSQLSKLVIPEDDNTFGYNLIIKDGRVVCSYSLQFDSGIPDTLLSKEAVFKTVTNLNIVMPFSKEMLKNFKEYGTIYKRKINAKNPATIL